MALLLGQIRALLQNVLRYGCPFAVPFSPDDCLGHACHVRAKLRFRGDRLKCGGLVVLGGQAE